MGATGVFIYEDTREKDTYVSSDCALSNPHT